MANNDESAKGITQELIDNILENVCLLLNIVEPVLPVSPTPEQQEEYEKKKAEYDYDIEVLTYYITAICVNIVIKTNRRKFPIDLKYLVVEMVNDSYNNANPNALQVQQIQSMTEYDRTVSFSSSSAFQTKLNLLAQQQIQQHEQLINRFKLLYKT